MVAKRAHVYYNSEKTRVGAVMLRAKENQLKPYLRRYSERKDIRARYGGRRVWGFIILQVADRILASGYSSVKIPRLESPEEERGEIVRGSETGQSENREGKRETPKLPPPQRGIEEITTMMNETRI